MAGAITYAVVSGILASNSGRRTSPSRKASANTSGNALGVVVLWLVGIAVAIQVIANMPPAVSVVLFGGIGAGAFFFFRHKAREKERQRVARQQAVAAEHHELDAHLAKHSRTLAVRYAGLAAVNGYGTPDAPAWAKEVQRFMDSVGFRPAALSPEIVHGLITQHVESHREQPVSPQAAAWPAEAMHDPMAFEQACAAQLRALGWDANTTAGSGDQGIDVEARKAGVRVVVQCKLYSQAVGNGAVQEALSGKAFAKAHIAAVVSNAGFTRKAHELATATGVLLLHHTELARIDEQALALRQAYAARKAAAAVPANDPAAVERGIMGNVKRSA